MPKHSLSRLRSELTLILKVGIVLLSTFTFLSFFGFDGFLFDIFSHFPLQYLTTGLFGLAIFLRQRSWCFVILSAFLIASNTVAVANFVSLTPTELNSRKGIRLLVANVRTANAKYTDFIALIKLENPAVAVVLEVNQDWVNALRPLDEIYPYRLAVPRSDNFGILMLSSLPLSNSRAEPLEPGQPPSLTADVRVEDRNITLIAVHTMPPASPHRYWLRNRQFLSIEKIARENRASTIVLGDLNSTMWSASYKRLITSSGFLDPRQMFGVLPTWPRQLPFLYIPIDHILYSSGIRAASLKTVPIAGSDHRGLLAQIVFENPNPPGV